jgi:catechol 2,3-dioxygenase-like lactoylglutathione lyase family enzyme
VEQKLEAVVVPVSDVDRSRHFYRALGFRLDNDRTDRDGSRFVQLTPPGSSCSIIIGTGLTSSEPGGTIGILIVTDLKAALADLQARGAAPSPVAHRPDGSPYASLRDPDGNRWLLASS